MDTDKKFYAYNIFDATKYTADTALKSLIGPLALLQRITLNTGSAEDTSVLVGPAMDDGAALIDPATPQAEIDANITLMSGKSFGSNEASKSIPAMAPDIRFYEAISPKGPWKQITALSPAFRGVTCANCGRTNTYIYGEGCKGCNWLDDDEQARLEPDTAPEFYNA